MKSTLKKNVLEIRFKRGPRTQAQRRLVQQMLNDGDITLAQRYLRSINGRSERRELGGALDTKRNPYPYRSAVDLLAIKKPNSTMSKLLQMTDPSRQHAPISKDTSYIGVEIECFIPYDSCGLQNGKEDCDTCNGSGVYECDDSDCSGEHECDECEGRGYNLIDSHSAAHKYLKRMFQDKKIKFVSVKSDGSIEPPDETYFPVEVTVLTRLSDSSNLKSVCAILKSLGARVNKSCGMHIHLDARHRTLGEVEEIGNKFKRVMPLMAAMVPKTRRTNSYCRLSVSGTGSGAERYHAVNLTAYSKYKTIEIRLHSSTTDYKKIINWSTFLTLIANGDKVGRICNDLNSLTDFVRLPEDLMEYCQQRIDLFSDKPTDINRENADEDSTDVPEIVPIFRESQVINPALEAQLALITAERQGA